MREIKFRAWNGVKMWYPETLTPDKTETDLTFYNPMRGIGWGLYDSKYQNRFASGEYHELMQYTGLKDKNGKEIYEGDVIKDSQGDVGYVMYHESENSAEYIITTDGENGWYFWDSEPNEIIGNIHENPELCE